MHETGIRQHIVDRVMARRGKLHWYERLDPARTALVVIDMQSMFCEPGAPAEVPASRGIVAPINALLGRLRQMGVPVIWVLHANVHHQGRSDWKLFFDHVVASDIRRRTIDSLVPGRQKVWDGLEARPDDLVVVKNRYSAMIPGASSLERVLRNLGVDTILIAGTKTNICCESTGRDAMMMDFQVVMVSDCCAALSDDEHRGALETFIQQFGDVYTSAEVLRCLEPQGSLQGASP